MKHFIAFLLCLSLALLPAPAVNVVVVQPAAAPPAGDTEFVTGQTLGTPLNNFEGNVGCRIDVAGSNVTVTELGMWVIAGSSQTHTVALYANDGTTLLGSVSVNTVGAPTGAIKYVALGSPVVLNASTSYLLVRSATNGGDQWYSNDTTVTTTAVATVAFSAYGSPTPIGPDGSAGQCRGIVSFKYSSP